MRTSTPPDAYVFLEGCVVKNCVRVCKWKVEPKLSKWAERREMDGHLENLAVSH